MQMDSRVILAGQPVDAIGALDSGTRAASNAANVMRQGQLETLYSQQGPGIMAGEQNALDALSRLDPMAGLGVQESRQGMRIREEQLQMARASAARSAESHAAQMSAAERAQQAEALSQGLSMAIPAIQSGDLNQVNAILAQGGLEPVQSIEDAQIRLAQAEGAFEVLQRYSAMQPQAPERETQNIGGVLYDLTQYNQTGNPDDLVALTQAQGQTIQFAGPDGTTFMMGPGGQQQQVTGPDADLPAPITEPVEGARGAFGFPSVFQGAANTAADAVGADMPFPETDTASTQIQLTADALLQELAAGYDRQPPSWLMQSIRENIPQPGQAFGGPQRAQNRYSAIQQDLQSQLAVEEQARARTRDPREAEQITRRMSALRNSIARIDRITEGMNPDRSLAPEDADLIERYLD